MYIILNMDKMEILENVSLDVHNDSLITVLLNLHSSKNFSFLSEYFNQNINSFYSVT